MPEADYSLVNACERDREVGYELVPGRFGPPPGIRREVKERLDGMAVVSVNSKSRFIMVFSSEWISLP